MSMDAKTICESVAVNSLYRDGKPCLCKSDTPMMCVHHGIEGIELVRKHALDECRKQARLLWQNYTCTKQLLMSMKYNLDRMRDCHFSGFHPKSDWMPRGGDYLFETASKLSGGVMCMWKCAAAYHYQLKTLEQEISTFYAKHYVSTK